MRSCRRPRGRRGPRCGCWPSETSSPSNPRVASCGRAIVRTPPPTTQRTAQPAHGAGMPRRHAGVPRLSRVRTLGVLAGREHSDSESRRERAWGTKGVPACSTDAGGRASSGASARSAGACAAWACRPTRSTVFGLLGSVATAFLIASGHLGLGGRRRDRRRRQRPARRRDRPRERPGQPARRVLRFRHRPGLRRAAARRGRVVPRRPVAVRADPRVRGRGVSMLVSYERARAEALGLDARGGLMERAERFVFLGVALAFDILVPVLWIMLVLTAATAVYRFVYVYRQAAHPPPCPHARERRMLPRDDAPPIPVARRRCARGGRAGGWKGDRTRRRHPLGAPQLASLSRARRSRAGHRISRTAPARPPRSSSRRRSPRRSRARSVGRRRRSMPAQRRWPRAISAGVRGDRLATGRPASTACSTRTAGTGWRCCGCPPRCGSGAVAAHFTIEGFEHIEARSRARARA